jgi:hypothetical protein
VSKPNKPDLARGWLFVEKLLAEDENKRLAEASDEDVAREMSEKWVEPSRVPSAEELLARAMDRAAKRGASMGPASSATVKARPVPARRRRWVPVLAAAAIGGLAIAVAIKWSEPPVAHPGPHDDAGSQPELTPQERAATLREKAFAACGAARWAECGGRLDDAKRLDPAGEDDVGVKATRAAVAASKSADGGMGKTGQ